MSQVQIAVVQDESLAKILNNFFASRVTNKYFKRKYKDENM